LVSPLGATGSAAAPVAMAPAGTRTAALTGGIECQRTRGDDLSKPESDRPTEEDGRGGQPQADADDADRSERPEPEGKAH
jgi:hypothetical protein